MRPQLIFMTLILAAPALAQSSASYDLSEHVFNAAGHPSGGTMLTSTSYRMSMDALGEGVARTGLQSASYGMDAGFVPAYPPPGEVHDLVFVDEHTINWEPEKSVGSYDLYRDLISVLVGGGYGECEQQDLPDETASVWDTPPAGDGYFYLVTAENRLGAEGTMGNGSDGTERANLSPCP